MELRSDEEGRLGAGCPGGRLARMSQRFVLIASVSSEKRVHLLGVVLTNAKTHQHDERYRENISRRTRLPPVHLGGPRVEVTNYSSRRVRDG
jgi:hypothetical protein